MLVPLIHTCSTVIYVYSTIPVLPEEESCLITCCFLLASPLLVILLAAVQHFLFRKYNTSGHPWKKLLSSRRVFHLGVRLTDSSGWKISEVERRLSEVWQDPDDPEAKGKVEAIEVERLADWGQPEEGQAGLWKATVTVSPELDFPQFETMARAQEELGLKVEKLLRQELRSGEEPIRDGRDSVDSRSCLCSCNPQVQTIVRLLFYLDLSLSGHSVASLQISFFSSGSERSEDDLRWLFCLFVHREGRQADLSL